jgi:hypothetical protein
MGGQKRLKIKTIKPSMKNVTLHRWAEKKTLKNFFLQITTWKTFVVDIERKYIITVNKFNLRIG